MGELSSFQLGVIGALFLSVASSVSIVICNKALMSNLGFPFATTLTSWHLIVTFCTLHVAQCLNLFVSKSIDMKTVMLFGILNGVSIGFLNLSLGFNSIGFYQEVELQNHNNYLRAKIAEYERAQQQQPNMVQQGNVCETMASQPYDRNFFPVNLLDSNHQYSRQDSRPHCSPTCANNDAVTMSNTPLDARRSSRVSKI